MLRSNFRASNASNVWRGSRSEEPFGHNIFVHYPSYIVLPSAVYSDRRRVPPRITKPLSMTSARSLWIHVTPNRECWIPALANNLGRLPWSRSWSEIGCEPVGPTRVRRRWVKTNARATRVPGSHTLPAWGLFRRVVKWRTSRGRGTEDTHTPWRQPSI